MMLMMMLLLLLLCPPISRGSFPFSVVLFCLFAFSLVVFLRGVGKLKLWNLAKLDTQVVVRRSAAAAESMLDRSRIMHPPDTPTYASVYTIRYVRPYVYDSTTCSTCVYTNIRAAVFYTLQNYERKYYPRFDIYMMIKCALYFRPYRYPSVFIPPFCVWLGTNESQESQPRYVHDDERQCNISKNMNFQWETWKLTPENPKINTKWMEMFCLLSISSTSTN